MKARFYQGEKTKLNPGALDRIEITIPSRNDGCATVVDRIATKDDKINYSVEWRAYKPGVKPDA